MSAGPGLGERITAARKDILAGLMFVGFGLAFAVLATGYDIGTTLRMGPGYFPLALGTLLVVIGIAVIAKGFVAGDGGAIGDVPWRALGLVIAAVIFFGITVRGLGLVPATFVAALMSAFASQRTGVLAALLIGAGLTALSVLVFVVGLSLRLELFGPWIRF